MSMAHAETFVSKQLASEMVEKFIQLDHNLDIV